MSDLATARDGKFQSDVLWNFASIAVLGFSGIALNSLIGGQYGPAALGVFGQVWAWYVFFSQLAVGGVDLSVLKATSEHQRDRAKVAEVVLGALAPTLALALASTLVFFGASGLAARIAQSDGVAVGMALAAPGLFFFALNKVLFGVVNGLQRMRAFALLQSSRFVLMLGGYFTVRELGWPAERIAFLFTFAEAILFAMLAVEVGRQIPWRVGEAWRSWVGAHLRFGVKSVLSGVLLELNSRVDVLMIGYYLDDVRVGVYTFAAMIAEGVFQLQVKLQNVYNPRIAQALASGRHDELRAMVRKGRVWSWALMFAVGAIAVAGYPLALDVLRQPPEMDGGLPAFATLLLGIALSAGYMPFQQTLLMGNRPGWHSAMMLMVVAINFVGAALLIPRLELVGAATATAFAMIASVAILRALVKRQLGTTI